VNRTTHDGDAFGWPVPRIPPHAQLGPCRLWQLFAAARMLMKTFRPTRTGSSKRSRPARPA